jgi:hypothetical protein
MTADSVGPVLEVGELATAIVAAIRDANANVTVVDRGSYVRVLVPHRCIVRRDAIERALGRAFVLPGDLERAMPSFKGVLTIDSEQAMWAWRGQAK